MKIIRFFILLLVIASFLITSCKKNGAATDPSKLLPSVISYYAGVDSLLYSNYYYYDNDNRIIKQATIRGGVAIYYKTYNYDNNGNLTSIMELNPHETYGYVTDTDRYALLTPPVSSYPVKTAPVNSYDTLSYAIRYTNGQPDSAIVTGGRYKQKQSINYVIENNKVSKITINTQMSLSAIYTGGPIPEPVYTYLHRTVGLTYTGDDVTQTTDGNDVAAFYYNTHKSAFCNINMKWFLPEGSGDNGFYKHDMTKQISPLGLGLVIAMNYNSTYNEYDYPVQTNVSLITDNANTQYYSIIKFIKYTYIAAR